LLPEITNSLVWERDLVRIVEMDDGHRNWFVLEIVEGYDALGAKRWVEATPRDHLIARAGAAVAEADAEIERRLDELEKARTAADLLTQQQDTRIPNVDELRKLKYLEDFLNTLGKP
jgi:hypothetical protein